MPPTSVNLSTLDWFSLISSTASLILAIISIWLAMHFYFKSKEAEKNAANLLVKIGVQAELLQKMSNKMLDKYVTYSTQPKAADESYVLLAQIVQSTLLTQGLPSNGATVGDKQIMQELTTLYIAVMYHSALANVVMQPHLPLEMSELDGSPVKTLVDRSHADFVVAKNWLTEHGNGYIESSPAKQYYDEIDDEIESGVRDTLGAYTARADQE